MDNAERCIAVGHRIDQYADSQQVVDLVNALAVGGVLVHLLVDAINMFRAAADVCFNAVAGEFILQHRRYLAHILLANLSFSVEEVGDEFILLGLQVAEGQVFKLPLDLPDAEPRCQGCVYLHCFAGDASLVRGV